MVKSDLVGGIRLNRMGREAVNDRVMFLGKILVGILTFLFGTGFCFAVELKEAEITALKNIVEHDTGDGKGAAPAKASEKIFEKSKVSTAAASMAELTFADTSITRVGSNTSFSFQSKERLVKLDKGTILINTPPGAGGATVDCGGVTAAVTGTTFMASVDANGNKMFVLLEGAGGMKVTAGGKVTMVRAGQAASVGGGADGGKKEESGGGAGEKKAGGDQPAADKKESGGDTAGGGDKPSAGGPSAGPDAKGGGDKPTAGGPTPKADQAGSGGTGGGGERKALAPPTIQVFDVDVKKVVASTPLIQAFDKPLPSAQKIQATVEVQQAKMSEGKMESLGVEIVAVKADGDVLVGAPKVVAEAPPKKEEVKADAPAKKEDVVAKKEEGGGAKKEDGGMKPEPKADGKMAGGPAPDNLDISTAAGPGAGAPPAPSGTSVAAATPPPPPAAPSILPPPVNIGQIVNQRPQELAPIVLTVRANDASRAFGAPNPDFGFSITAGGLLSGHSVVTDLRTAANNFSEVSGGPFAITLEGLRILDGSGRNVTSRYDLTRVSGVLTLTKAEQSINFALPSNLTFGANTDLRAVAQGEVSFEVVSGPATINANGKLVATSGTGTVVVRATATGDQNYNGAFADQTVTLIKAGQSVNFTLPTSLTYNDRTALSATALDSGTVSFQVVSGPGTIDSNGRLVATSGTGSVVVRATAAGDQNYNSALAEQTITLGKAGQSVNFTLPTSLTYDTTASLGATVTGAGSVTYELVNAADSSLVSISGGVLRATSGTGSVVVRATAAGDQNYNSALAEQTITLGKAAQNLSFNAASPILTGNSRSMPVLGVQTGSPTYSILETDGRASVDSAGNVTVGKILGASSFTIRAAAAGDNNYLSADKDLPVLIDRNVSAIEAANPVRQLLALPPSPELQALDEFFYFTGKTSSYSGGPDRFFADAGVGDTDRTLANLGVSAQLYSSQNWDFFAARKFTADPGVLNLAPPSAGKSEVIYFGNTVDLGAAHPVWQGTVDPRTASTSLGSRYLTLNSDYLPVYDKTLVGAQPTGFFDSFGSYLSPLENFPVWDDAGGSISSADQVQINLAGSRVSTLAAGSGGIAGRGLEIDANGGGVQMLTSGDLNLKTTRLADVGSGASGEGLTLEARGKVKLGTDGRLDLDVPTNAGVPEKQQVRLEARTDPINGNPLTGSLAVVRTGDSLELRNVTVRGFAETRLEKVNPTTKAVEGRVLISGSAVRDFKIKELVGMAVNADAKIQMMALDQNGALAGDMVVAGKMPVEAKIASALKEAGETLPSATAGAMVDAKQIDLAARNLKFENANLVAMNAITARANTILIQNSFMTVVRNQGMINMYVQSGLVNTSYGTQMAGRVNFDGANKFQIGSNYFEIGNQAQLSAAYGTNLIDFSQNGGTPQAGKVNVLRL